MISFLTTSRRVQEVLGVKVVSFFRFNLNSATGQTIRERDANFTTLEFSAPRTMYTVFDAVEVIEF